MANPNMPESCVTKCPHCGSDGPHRCSTKDTSLPWRFCTLCERTFNKGEEDQVVANPKTIGGTCCLTCRVVITLRPPSISIKSCPRCAREWLSGGPENLALQFVQTGTERRGWWLFSWTRPTGYYIGSSGNRYTRWKGDVLPFKEKEGV